MKKWLWVILAVVALVLIAAVTWYLMTDWTVTIGICYRDATDDSNRAYRQSLEKALTDLGYEVIAVDSGNDQAKQLRQLEELVDRTCLTLIVEPVMTSATEELMTALQELAVPAVLVGKEPQTDLAAFPNISFVGHDGTVPGILQAQMLLGLPDGGDLNGDGVVSCLILQGPENDLDAAIYTESCKKALKLGPLGADVLEVSAGDRTYESGMRRCAGALSRFGKDVEVILCDHDGLALGAVAAVTDGGWQVGKDVYVLSAGGDPAALELVREGKLTGTVLELTDDKLQTVVTVAQKLMEGQSVESYYFLKYTPVTDENVASVGGN